MSSSVSERLTHELGTQSILKLLLRFSIPSLISNLMFTVYNVVDRLFISWKLGTDAIAGVGITFYLFMIFIAVGMMFGIGGGTLVSLKLGEKDKESAERILGNVIMIFLVGGALTTLLGFLFLKPLLYCFGASDITYPYAAEYFRILLWFMAADFLSMGTTNIIRAEGSPHFSMWQAVKDDISLIDYSFSVANAKKALEDGGWVYNSKGEAFVEGQSGVDSVRYKKLTQEEAEACDGVNKTYASVNNEDGITYKTVEINGEYYMPLVINWFGATPNSVTDLLTTNLANSKDVKDLGIVIRATTGDFTKLLGEIYREASYGYAGTPTYGMFNLATGWNNSVYDYSYNWSLDPTYFGYSSNKLYDEYDKAFPYDIKAEKLSYEEAMKQSDGKLGMDYLSMAMVYNAKTEDEYNEWWEAYIERWSELMPDIPLYSNLYYDVFNGKISGFETSPFFGPAYAIVYASVDTS